MIPKSRSFGEKKFGHIGAKSVTSSLDDVTTRHVQKRYTADFEAQGSKLTF